MTMEQSVGLSIGGLSVLASAALGASEQAGFAMVATPIISSVVGAAVSYGLLRGTVRALERDRDETRADFARFRAETHAELRAIREATQHTATQVARIEGMMEHRGQPRD
jgi:hypothetical protein